MYGYFFLAAIIIGLVIILFIIIRKFSQLANLDLANLPQEKETQKKKEIILKRIEAEGEELKKRWAKRMAPVAKWWGLWQLKFRVYVGKVERLWHHERQVQKAVEGPQLTSAEVAAQIESLIRDGELHLAQNQLDQAEEKFIGAIKINAQAAGAYRGLADTYLAKGSMPEAKQTYEFLLKLEPSNDSAMVKLADLFEKEGDLQKAIEWYQQAVIVNDSLSPRFYHLAELLLRIGQPETAKEAILSAIELEPKNPKYLDLAVETAILVNDQTMANKYYSEFRLVNPENNKLVDFRERISKL